MDTHVVNKEIGNLYKIIYEATSKRQNHIALITPLVREAHKNNCEKMPQSFEQTIQPECAKFTEKMDKERLANEIDFDRFKRAVHIRSILQKYYECERTHMSFRKLFQHVKPICGVLLTQDRFKLWLNRLGFCLETVPHNRKIVIETHSQKLARLRYIRRIHKLRQDQRNIVYFREVTINMRQIDVTTSLEPLSLDELEVTAFFAASATGGLLNFAFVEKSSISAENFVEWLTIMAANLPNKSVFVIEPKKYSSPAKPSLFDDTLIPTLNKCEHFWKKLNVSDSAAIEQPRYGIEMLDFCWKNRHKYEHSIAAPDLTKALQDIGVDVVHLPCLHPELSPLHQIDFSDLLNGLEDGQRRCTETIKNMIRCRLDGSTFEEWQRYFTDVIAVENKFMQFEALQEEEERIIDARSNAYDDVQIVGENSAIITLSDDDEE